MLASETYWENTMKRPAFYLAIVLGVICLALCGGCSTSVMRTAPDGAGIEAGPGAGGYTLDNTVTTTTNPDGSVVEQKKCHLDATSARDVNGVEVEVDENCAMKAKVEKTSGVEAQTRAMTDMFKAGQDTVLPLLQYVLPAATIPVPAPATPATGLLLPTPTN
jgi:hypothetical protein